MLANALEHFLVGLHLVGAYIDDKGAAVGNDIVLGASVDEGDGHLCGAQKRTDLGELGVAQPLDVVECMIDGVVALLASGMSRAAVSGAVEHHESAFGNGRLHASGLTDECHIDGREQGQHAFDAACATDFFLGGGKEDEVVVARGGFHCAIGLQKADKRSAVVVAAQSVDAVTLACGLMGLARPAVGGAHGVDVGAEQQGRALGRVVVAGEPKVVAVALWCEPVLCHPVGQMVGNGFLLTAYAWDFYELA